MLFLPSEVGGLLHDERGLRGGGGGVQRGKGGFGRSQVDGLLCFFALLLESDWGCREQLATLCLGKTWGNKSTMILAEFPLISALCCMIHEI